VEERAGRRGPGGVRRPDEGSARTPGRRGPRRPPARTGV